MTPTCQPVENVEITIRTRRRRLSDLTGGFATYADPRNRKWLVKRARAFAWFSIVMTVFAVGMYFTLLAGSGQ